MGAKLGAKVSCVAVDRPVKHCILSKTSVTAALLHLSSSSTSNGCNRTTASQLNIGEVNVLPSWWKNQGVRTLYTLGTELGLLSQRNGPSMYL